MFTWNIIRRQIIKPIFIIEASDFLDPVKNAINEIDPGHGLTCNCKGTEQLRTHYKINEKYQKKYSDIFSLALSVSRKHVKNTRNSIHKIMWLLSLYSPKASIYSKWKLLFLECFYSVKHMYLSWKKYNIMKLEFSIFVYFIMFTKDLRIYFIFLPILLYIRYVHVN